MFIQARDPNIGAPLWEVAKHSAKKFKKGIFPFLELEILFCIKIFLEF
jgi:hypothetical protein